MSISFTAAPRAKVANAFGKALFALREQAHTDCNYFVRFDQGTLRSNSYTKIDALTLCVVWPEVYAKRVYYTGTPSTDKNPHASLLWAEKARSEFGKTWGKILEKGVKANL